MKDKTALGTAFLIIIMALCAISISMMASLSFPASIRLYGNYYYFLLRQSVWIGIGLVIFYIFSKIDYKWYKKKRKIIYILSILMLVLVLILGKEANGAKRWIQIGPMTLQPSEFVKIFYIVYLAATIEWYKKKKMNSFKILLISFGSLLFLCVLIYLEKAFSSTLQLLLIGGTMLYMAKINLKYYFMMFGGLLATAGISSIAMKYRQDRIEEYAALLKGNYDEIGHQVQQSLIAVGSGGILGRSYGNGLQKYFYLPEIHTDYIFAGYAEECGLVGSIVLIALYIGLLFIILATIARIKDMFARYILIGIYAMFFIQIFGNISVVLGLLPSTGIPLPIVGYGGSSIIAVMISLGIAYNIIKHIGLD